MLEYLGEEKSAQAVLTAMKKVVKEGPESRDADRRGRL
jgi:isocitrate/isopropylmalate dehydrogenase